MDCEKFDQIILDALYGELDELTLAAAKRHSDGCQRCQAAWSGLKATRKVGALALVPAPAGLQDSIMARAREAHRNVTWPTRFGRIVSRAGDFAMRPQTAAAAILLLAIGGALVFVQPKPNRSTAQVAITEHGVPGQPADEPRPFDDRPSAIEAAPRRDEPFALGSAAPLAVAERPAEESRAAAKDKLPDDELAAPPPIALRRSAAASEPKGTQVGGAGLPAVAAAPLGAVAGDDLDTSGRKREAPQQQQEGYAGAMALYNAHRYAEAEPALTAVAAAGGRNAPMAALYAAKSAKESQGCSVAGPRFEQVWVRYSGTNPGAEALWEAANCYKALGDIAKAARYYRSLRDVAGFGDRAETELQNLAPQRAAPAKPAAPAATQQRQQQPAASGATGR